MKISKRIEILLRFFKARTKYFEEEELNPYAPSEVIEDMRKEMEREMAIYKKKIREVDLRTLALEQQIIAELTLN